MTQKRWLERAKETHKFHRSRMLSDEDWKLTHTATALRRSLGSICEDIKIVKALKIYEKEIEKFEFAYQALEFIRKKEKKIDVEEIE